MDAGYSADEVDRELKKSKRKEKKESKEREVDAEESKGEENGMTESVAANVETESKKKKPKEGALGSGGDGDASHTREKPGSGVREPERAEKTRKKKKKKERKDDASAITTDGDTGQAGNRSASGADVLGERTITSSKVDHDTKGGVKPLDKGAFRFPGQSADRIEQQRPKPDATSDNEWLRAKTSRLLDLVGSDLENDRPATPRSEERSNEAATNQEDENTGQPTTSSVSAPRTSIQNCLLSTGRLFVRNLSYTTNKSEIEKLFSKYGHLKEVRVFQNTVLLIFHDEHSIGTAYAMQLMLPRKRKFSRYLLYLIRKLRICAFRFLA